jgi:hypothetical protein
MVKEEHPKMVRVWLSLIIPPILLAIITMIVATYIGIKTHGASGAIGEGIVSSLPYILMVNHTLLFLILLAFIRSDGISLGSIGWQLPSGKKSLWLEPVVGMVAGIVLGLFGHFALEPIVEIAQRTIGNYQSGSGAYIIGGRIPWLISVTVFAGIVEESIYRGYAIRRLSLRMETGWAIIVSSVLYGLLHWGQGLWAMVGTMIFGAFLAGIFIWRRNLLTAAVAHAVMNIVIESYRYGIFL